MIQLNKDAPVIMLLGRTNVGKSSLFNLLIDQRQAIVSDIAGSTRDLVKREIRLAGYSCLLIDSGGIQFEGTDELGQQAQSESWRQKEQSDLILFVLEAGTLTGADEELLQKLRPIANKVLLVINKADTAELEMAAWDVLAYGFPHLQPVSVKRRRNIGQLRRLMLQHLQSLDFQPGDEVTVEKKILRLALIGRPNSGKSTLLNSLAETEIALVSPQAGTTRDALIYQGEWFNQAFGIIDTAGIRRKGKVSQSLEYYALQRSFQALDEADVAALLIDATQGITDQDKKIAARALEQGNALLFVINKIDLIDKEELHLLKENLRYSFPQLAYAPVLLISAKNKLGCKVILKEALSLYNQAQRRIPTSQLNQAVADWQLFQPIPQRGRNSYKIRYIVQQDAMPPCFIVFVNIVKDFPSSYQGYLVNQLRREFGFPHVPIKLEFRQRQTWPERQKQYENPRADRSTLDQENGQEHSRKLYTDYRKNEQKGERWQSNNEQRPSQARNRSSPEHRPSYRKDEQRGARRQSNNEQRPFQARNRSSQQPSYRKDEQQGARWQSNNEQRPFQARNNRSSQQHRPSYRQDEQQGARRQSNNEQRPFQARNNRSSQQHRPSYRKDEQQGARWQSNNEQRPFQARNRSSQQPSYRKDEQQGARRQSNNERRPFQARNNRSSQQPSYRKDEQQGARWQSNNEQRPFQARNRSSQQPSYRKDEQQGARWQSNNEQRPSQARNRSSQQPSYRKDEQQRARWQSNNERRPSQARNRSSQQPSYRKDEQQRARWQSNNERRPSQARNRSSQQPSYRQDEQQGARWQSNNERRPSQARNRSSEQHRPSYRQNSQNKDKRQSKNNHWITSPSYRPAPKR